ncbi:MAG: chromosomal replication initiator protein DnaA [Solirubrobacterales bacterium]|nr:chromosomal replication initiator protein DnaA [Solirubrobacterales bacterium]
MNEELDRIWSRVQAELEGAVDEATYRIWLEPLQARAFDGATLTLEGPTRVCGWIRERFGGLLQRCAAAALGPDVAVELVELEQQGGVGVGFAAEGAGALRGRGAGPPHQHVTARGRLDTPAGGQAPEHDVPLNPKLTFEQFVIGNSNRLAHAAALAVAEMPGGAYNPLFICGPPGVGKTHLLRAIAALVAEHSPELVVRATTGEAFANEFIFALGGGSVDGFKHRFRQVDLLLVDDVQFLERKSRTEEEFFHTFNALYEVGGQIVLSSDRPPRDLQALEDRLRERFQAGLVADIHPPELPTRIAILRKRAHHDALGPVSDEVLEPIAERVSINVRALEGALIRVVAFASLTGRELTRELTVEVLDGLYPVAGGARSPRHRCTLEEIEKAACAQFGLTPEELRSSTRRARVAWPRQMAMYLARELSGESLPAIGKHFGGRDHTTVLHAWRRTGERIGADPGSREDVEKLRQRLDAAGS